MCLFRLLEIFRVREVIDRYENMNHRRQKVRIVLKKKLQKEKNLDENPFRKFLKISSSKWLRRPLKNGFNFYPVDKTDTQGSNFITNVCFLVI